MREFGARETSNTDKLRRLTWTVRRRSFAALAAAVISCASLVCTLVPGPARAAEAASSKTGSISGEVRITQKLTSQRMRFRLYPGFKPLPPPSGVGNLGDERRNVVIYLESAPSTNGHSSVGKNPQIAQIGETFVPHVLPIVTGTTVDFPNEDPIFHNVFSLSGTKSFDLGRYPKGDSRSVTFDHAGIVPVFCHLHSNMSAVIMILDNPFFAVPDAAGNYRIENVPPGSYTLVGWHERSQRVRQRVNVLSGQAVELNIVIPIEDDTLPGQ